MIRAQSGRWKTNTSLTRPHRETTRTMTHEHRLMHEFFFNLFRRSLTSSCIAVALLGQMLSHLHSLFSFILLGAKVWLASSKVVHISLWSTWPDTRIMKWGRAVDGSEARIACDPPCSTYTYQDCYYEIHSSRISNLIGLFAEFTSERWKKRCPNNHSYLSLLFQSIQASIAPPPNISTVIPLIIFQLHSPIPFQHTSHTLQEQRRSLSRL